MRDLAPGGAGRPHLDGAHPARLGERNLRERLEPDVLALGRHGVRLGRENHIRLRRTVSRAASRHPSATALAAACPWDRPAARRHPPSARWSRICVVAQRHVVLEFLNADGLIQMPRRHGAADHALLDGFGPRTRLLVGHQRHRRHGAFAMAALAFFLKDGLDVLGERGGLVAGQLRRARECRQYNCQQQDSGSSNRHELPPSDQECNQLYLPARPPRPPAPDHYRL